VGHYSTESDEDDILIVLDLWYNWPAWTWQSLKDVAYRKLYC